MALAMVRMRIHAGGSKSRQQRVDFGEFSPGSQGRSMSQTSFAETDGGVGRDVECLSFEFQVRVRSISLSLLQACWPLAVMPRAAISAHLAILYHAGAGAGILRANRGSISELRTAALRIGGCGGARPEVLGPCCTTRPFVHDHDLSDIAFTVAMSCVMNR